MNDNDQNTHRPYTRRTFLAQAAVAGVGVAALEMAGSAQAHGETIPNTRRELDTRPKLIESIVSCIAANYIFPDVARRLEQSLHLQLASGVYDSIADPQVLAQMLTSHLRQESKDRHFFVGYSEEALPPDTQGDEQKEQQEANYLNSLENFGFEAVTRLGGNIGWLDFRGFAEPHASAKTLAAAMTFLSNTNALIIDVRKNRGGDQGMVELFCSYFFEKKTRLGNFYYRNTGITQPSWTRGAVAGTRYSGKDVYVLTSAGTLSAAEALAYALQSRRVAVVVGEASGGAANPVKYVRLNQHFSLLVPEGKITDMVTKTNWEGVGVKPDITAPADQALTAAHLLALRKNLERKTRSELSETELHQWIATLEKASKTLEKASKTSGK